MAIYKMVGDKERLEEVAATSFGHEGVLERADLQRILRDQPEVLEEGLLIIAEEFGNWQDSNRRIDLLALDSTGRLVVIELKRGETGQHMDLQAIRYAAMVANMTYQQAVDTCQSYLESRAADDETVEEDAGESLIRDHLAGIEEESQVIRTEIPRIILASENFSKELTTCVMWLNDSWLRNENLDIKCVRLQPHRSGENTLLEVSQIIPLPEAQDYLVRVREREEERNSNLGSGQYWEGGSEPFRESIGRSEERFHEQLSSIYEWALELEQEELASLSSVISSENRITLVVYADHRPLVSVQNFLNSVRFRLQPNNIKTIAPNSIPDIDEQIDSDIESSNSPVHRSLFNIPDLGALLSALTEAYREANGHLNSED